MGYRRHHLHGRRHGVVCDIARAGMANSWQKTEAGRSERCVAEGDIVPNH